jgi:hypothetical protein
LEYRPKHPHNVLAQSSSKGAAANATVVTVTPSQSTNKTFWINTAHVNGTTNIHAAVACDTCSQNTPLHPAEKFPNATVTAGPGLVLRPLNKVGAWDFRAFAFDPSLIVVNQDDKVTLHFVGVQGFHHVITVEGIGTFPLDRAQIHTVSFTANNPGTIAYTCLTWLVKYWYFPKLHKYSNGNNNIDNNVIFVTQVH